MGTAGRMVSGGSRLICLGLAGALLAGCSTMRPLGGAEPQVGTRVAFDVNDAGRVALGGAIGPEVAQVEGQLMEKNSEGYLLSVTTTRLLRGGEQTWSGEQVRVKPEYLSTGYERRFSLGRSIALGGVALGGFGVFMLSRELLGSGTSNDPPPCTVDCGGGNARLGRP